MNILPSLMIVAALVVGIRPSALSASLDEKEAEKACARYESYSPGPNAMPTGEDRRRFGNEKGCGLIVEESIGNRHELEEGRRCCLVKGDCNRELAMIFANGWGTRRDYDAALYFLCWAGEEMAAYEQSGMIVHVLEMMSGREKKDLLYCDHVTSGMGQLYCQQLEESRNASDREAKLEALRRTLDRGSQGRLDELTRAAEDFSRKEGALSAVADVGATGYPAESLSMQGKVYDTSISTIIRFSRERAPIAGAEELKRTEGDLNRAYGKALAAPPECAVCSDPKGEGVRALREAQRAWLKYRDAWIAFYLARWKGAAGPDELKSEISRELTLVRAEQLGQMREEKQHGGLRRE